MLCVHPQSKWMPHTRHPATEISQSVEAESSPHPPPPPLQPPPASPPAASPGGSVVPVDSSQAGNIHSVYRNVQVGADN